MQKAFQEAVTLLAGEKLGGSAWCALCHFTHICNYSSVHKSVCCQLSSDVVLQFHDYHGVVSLMYLSEAAKPSVMYVAHNADYNGAWALGSPARERYLYSMFNLPISRETRMCATLLTCHKP